MKKTYQQPQMEVLELKISNRLLVASGNVGNTSVGMSWDGSADSNEEGLSRRNSIWDDEE